MQPEIEPYRNYKAEKILSPKKTTTKKKNNKIYIVI